MKKFFIAISFSLIVLSMGQFVFAATITKDEIIHQKTVKWQGRTIVFEQHCKGSVQTGYSMMSL